jgi:hypothetical protein
VEKIIIRKNKDKMQVVYNFKFCHLWGAGSSGSEYLRS